MNRFLVVALSLSTLLTPVVAQANSIGIEVLSATYSTSLTLTSRSGATTTATATGSSSVSESLDFSDGSDTPMQGFTSADWLAVDVHLREGFFCCFGQGTADFDMTFSPVADGAVTLDGYFTRSGEYGSGFGSLFNVTTQQELWRFSFGSDFGGCDLCRIAITAGGVESFPTLYGQFDLPTVFNAADVYDLHLIASTFSPGTGVYSSVQVSGLVPVPEPSSLLLLGIGLVTLGTVRLASVTRRNGAKQ